MVFLSGHGLGRDHLSQGLDSGGTISPGGGTISPWDRTISPCVRCALIDPGICLHVHSLCEPGLGLFMRPEASSYPSTVTQSLSK